MRYTIRRTQSIQVETDDWALRGDETHWTDDMVLELAENDYYWGGDYDHYEIIYEDNP